MWTATQYRKLVRSSAWYDLIVTAAFATPWSFAALHGLLITISQALELPGDLPAFAPLHLLMANLLGSIVCVWAVLRIRDPQVVFGRYDAAGRFLFASWQLYALVQGASSLLVVFLFFEVVWGVLQMLPVRTNREQARSHRGPVDAAIPVGAGLPAMAPEQAPKGFDQKTTNPKQPMPGIEPDEP